jgi:hypothetical protein
MKQFLANLFCLKCFFIQRYTTFFIITEIVQELKIYNNRQKGRRAETQLLIGQKVKIIKWKL